MKLLLLSLFISTVVVGQSKFQMPKPIKDTSWYVINRDTTFGTISYKTASGIVKGEGIVVHWERWKYRKEVYSWTDRIKIQRYVDSVSKRPSGGRVWDVGEIGFMELDTEDAFIKKRGKWVEVKGYLYTLTAK